MGIDRAPGPGERPMNAVVDVAGFGALPDGTPVERWTLRNTAGMAVSVLTYGATIQAVEVPDADGRVANVALGFGDLAGYTSPRYLSQCPYFGSTIGRFANRIAGGRFTLDGTVHELPTNDGPGTLHGGTSGFDKRVWSAERAGGGVRMRYTSADGEQGFPGTLRAAVTISLDDRGCLRLDYRATADRPTVVNLTNHSYWNLAGEGSGSVHGHRLLVSADRYTPVDGDLIPTGAVDAVAGTPFDFRVPRAIGDRVRDSHPQLALAGGYDHNYVLSHPAGAGELQLAAVAVDPSGGRQVTVATTEPGMQFYSGNFLDGSFAGPSGRPYREGDGFALETQHFPDSPNQPGFPSAVLRPGATYRSSTSYTFSAAGPATAGRPVRAKASAAAMQASGTAGITYR
jgi:aldose 1-epimerase